jgi:hypothetical protein
LFDFVAPATGGLAVLFDDAESEDLETYSIVRLYDSELEPVDEWRAPAGVAARAISPDNEGNIVIAGHRLNSGTATFWLHKLDLHGLQPAWPAPIENDGGVALGVDVGPEGQIAAVGARPGISGNNELSDGQLSILTGGVRRQLSVPEATRLSAATSRFSRAETSWWVTIVAAATDASPTSAVAARLEATLDSAQ